MTENIERLLGFRPEVFAVSALLAQQAKDVGDRNPAERDRLWRESRFGALEQYIVETLDEESRIRLKLLSPLGIGEHLTDRYLKATNDRLAILPTTSTRSRRSTASSSSTPRTCAASSPIT